MGFELSSQGDLTKTITSLQNLAKLNIRNLLESCGQTGVNALRNATPVETGLAAHSWTYKVSVGNGSCAIEWHNVDVENGFQVVIRLQYGYGTGTGGYVAGRDFINPAMRPVFNEISNKIWEAVKSA